MEISRDQGPEEGLAECGSVSTLTNTPVKIYLVDDHEIVRRGLAEVLSQDGRCEVIGDSGSAVEAIARIPALRPDVAVLDGRLGDGSGMDVCREVRSIDPHIHCVILTSYDDDEAMMQAILAGAQAYVLKQIRGNELVDVVLRVAAGENLLDDGAAREVRDRIAATDISHHPALEKLTEQERRVLLLVADGMTNRQIAGELFLAEKTVKNYITSILAKLGLGSRTQAAVLVERLRTHALSAPNVRNLA
ncbi:LuxR family two component transcriptional regulator [Yimella lutea]|uniref:LuxR family two component transcriptional regulator n=1 Tax=Yimella lutea TaxID=587872 RepID=A0A542EJL4_9MICO|nr:LuxR family two component transcriptional regulator [Yimella lutea]